MYDIVLYTYKHDVIVSSVVDDMIMVLWGIPTAVIIMSFLYGISALYSAISNLKRKVWMNVNLENSIDDNYAPEVAIVLPLYREDKQSIMETFKSIAQQSYPSNKLSTYIVLENGDEDTKKHVEELKTILTSVGIEVGIYLNDGKRLGKARAINKVLRDIMKNQYVAIAILDAGDKVMDRYYIRKCVELVKNGYSIVGTKVYRVGRGIIARLSYVDTILWYNIGFPGIYAMTKTPFVSGEGMVIAMNFLRRIGMFPEVLAEDAYVAMLGLIYGEKIAFVNSMIFEGAPTTFKSLIKQRLRWYRGSLECLKDIVLKYRNNVAMPICIRACLAYMNVLALIAPFISLVIIVLSPFLHVPSYTLGIAKIEIISLFMSPIILYLVSEVKGPVIFLAPFNWILQSFIALLALIPIKMPWFRTSARSKIEIPYLRPYVEPHCEKLWF